MLFSPAPAQGNRALRSAQPPLPAGYNPKHWWWDPETGEWRLVTYRAQGSVLVSGKSYQERATEHLQAVRSSEGVLLYTIVSAGIVCLLEFLSGGASPGADAAGFLLLLGWVNFICAAVGWLCWLGKSNHLKARIGPPPVPIYHGGEVDEQRIHDTGGFMNGDELREALRGHGSRPFQVDPR